MELASFVDGLDGVSDFEWAFANYKKTVLALPPSFGSRRLLEVGAGRNPLLKTEQIAVLGVTYTLNDICQEELDLAPETMDKRCFDAAGDLSKQDIGCYDLIFSRMVLEHVCDGETAFRNAYELLDRGGVMFFFFPTLYSPPFVLNRMVPLRLTDWIRAKFFPERAYYERFPARYSLCYATGKVESVLQAIGFSEVAIVPFYGYSYFDKVPGLKQVTDTLSRSAMRNDWRSLASFAYCFARK